MCTSTPNEIYVIWRQQFLAYSPFYTTYRVLSTQYTESFLHNINTLLTILFSLLWYFDQEDHNLHSCVFMHKQPIGLKASFTNQLHKYHYWHISLEPPSGPPSQSPTGCAVSAIPKRPLFNKCEKKGTPSRGIEPRSPAWQAGILATILWRTNNVNLLHFIWYIEFAAKSTILHSSFTY